MSILEFVATDVKDNISLENMLNSWDVVAYKHFLNLINISGPSAFFTPLLASHKYRQTACSTWKIHRNRSVEGKTWAIADLSASQSSVRNTPGAPFLKKASSPRISLTKLRPEGT